MLIPLKKPLVFEELNLDDTVPTPDEVSDTIQPTFSVLTGRRGNRQFPVGINDSGELLVSSSSGIKVLGSEGEPLSQSSDDHELRTMVVGGGSNYAIWSGEPQDNTSSDEISLHVTDHYTKELYGIIDDVYSSVDGALKVDQI